MRDSKSGRELALIRSGAFRHEVRMRRFSKVTYSVLVSIIPPFEKNMLTSLLDLLSLTHSSSSS